MQKQKIKENPTELGQIDKYSPDDSEVYQLMNVADYVELYGLAFPCYFAER